MRRVIYCPTNDHIPVADKLAKNSHLPINVGEFEELINIDFDRNIVQVLEIPEIKTIIYMEEVEKGFHQQINYLNDFCIFNENSYILINNKKYLPTILEKHQLKFSIEEKEIGVKHAKIINNEKKIEEFKYNVY